MQDQTYEGWFFDATGDQILPASLAWVVAAEVRAPGVSLGLAVPQSPGFVSIQKGPDARAAAETIAREVAAFMGEISKPLSLATAPSIDLVVRLYPAGFETRWIVEPKPIVRGEIRMSIGVIAHTQQAQTELAQRVVRTATHELIHALSTRGHVRAVDDAEEEMLAYLDGLAQRWSVSEMVPKCEAAFAALFDQAVFRDSLLAKIPSLLTNDPAKKATSQGAIVAIKKLGASMPPGECRPRDVVWSLLTAEVAIAARRGQSSLK